MTQTCLFYQLSHRRASENIHQGAQGFKSKAKWDGDVLKV
jgi:hypothetical protein